MVQKMSKLFITDGTGLEYAKTFHLYKGTRRKTSPSGLFLKMSVKRIKKYPPKLAGKKYRPVRRGWKIRSLFVRQVFKNRTHDSSTMRYRQNACIVLKKKRMFRSKYYYGSLFHKFGQKKYKNMFKEII